VIVEFEKERAVVLSYEDLREGVKQIELATLATPFLHIEKFEPAFNLTVGFICCSIAVATYIIAKIMRHYPSLFDSDFNTQRSYLITFGCM
jgi:hypothetical protein